MKALELRQKRANLVSQARALLDQAEQEKRALNQEEENQYQKMWGEIEKLAGEIERSEKLEAAERELGQPVESATRPETSDGRAGGYLESAEYRQLATRWLVEGRGALSASETQRLVNEYRALQADADIYGGYLLAPMQMVREILKGLDNLVYVRQWANVIQVMGAAEGLGAASLDNDPADPIWTSELLTGDEDSTMSFGKRELKPSPLAKRIKISRKLLRKLPNVEALVNQRFTYKFGVAAENAYLNGTGVNQPLGVFVASANGISTGRDVSTGNTATSIMFDGLIEAKYTLKQGYWPRARWLFHRDGVKQVAKLKDGEGQYLWRESVRAGEPDRILGIPAFMSEYAPNTFTTGLYVGILGDWFTGYMIADDLLMEMQRLDELYAATNQVGYIGRLESDGMPVLEEAFVRVKLG